jgi:hypothetical protein
MAEVTERKVKTEKRILLAEDFESITHHAEINRSTGAYVQRAADAAHSGNAGLLLTTPASNNSYARALWRSSSTKHPIIALSFWVNFPTIPGTGYIHFALFIQKTTTLHRIAIRYNIITNAWEYFDETLNWQSLPEVTAVLGQNVWTNITIEVNTDTGRIIAIHVSEQSFRINKAYGKIPGPYSITTVIVQIELIGSAEAALTLYVDDLIVQEL